MCLYPKLIKNPRYIPNKKNKGIPPECYDERTKYVPIGCGKCIECKKQKARAWQTRLMEEIKCNKHAYFVTLTFENKELDKLNTEIGEDDSNATATLAVRRFLERYRKKNKHTLKHWLITELGQTNTERIHLHGIIFTEEEMTNEELFSYWKYGFCDTGQYCNERTINYIVKYVTKIDQNHKTFEPVILCSPGIGKNYTENEFYKNIYRYRPKNTREYYTLPNGNKINLCIYYRNKFYDEQTRQQMWIDRLDKNTIYVMGIECKNIDTPQGIRNYYKTLAQAQKENIALGFGDRSKEWQKEKYNTTLKDVIRKGKIAKSSLQK